MSLKVSGQISLSFLLCVYTNPVLPVDVLMQNTTCCVHQLHLIHVHGCTTSWHHYFLATLLNCYCCSELGAL